MSVAIHEREASQDYEVSVGSFEDLVDFSRDLGRLLTARELELDMETTAEIEELKNQVVDQVILTHEGEHAANKPYIFKITQEPVVRKAIQLAKQKPEPGVPVPDPAFAWLSDIENTHPVNEVPIKSDISRPLFRE
jgi:hypothetical protein